MRKAKNVLDKLTEKYPPFPGHAPHRIEPGDEAMPLIITLFLGEKVYQQIGLEEYDLDCSVAEIVAECTRVVEEKQYLYKELAG